MTDPALKIRFHTTAANREEFAADRATCVESARAHNVLANLHRLEAAKLDAVQGTMKIAFGY